MAQIINQIRRIFRSSQTVPEEYRPTFIRLYLEIAWFGILSGSTLAFLAVFATRQGATPQQIGLLSAVPALVNLLFALPAGSWLNRRSMGKTVFWSSVAQRFFFLLLIPLPVLLMPGAQVWSIIMMTLFMTIPGTVMVVGFNSIFGEVVPVEWRGYVVGIRNALLSVTATIFTLISAEILNRVAFPLNYQIVFAIGVAGAAMSSLQLYHLAKFVGEQKCAPCPVPTPKNGNGRNFNQEIRAIYNRGIKSLRLDAMQGKFGRIMGLLFSWYLVQFMTIPIITPFIVNQLHVSDQLIGLAAAFFNSTTFLGSLNLNRATGRFGNKTVTGGGIMGLSLFPILTAFGPVGYLLGNFVGGLAWSMAGGAIYNYILENAPGNDRPAYLAWYNLMSNGAILIGSLCGPAIAAIIGFPAALILFGVARFLAGVAITKWG